MKTIEETIKAKEDQTELQNEVKENTADTQEGRIPDEEAETAAGGFFIEKPHPHHCYVCNADTLWMHDRCTVCGCAPKVP